MSEVLWRGSPISVLGPQAGFKREQGFAPVIVEMELERREAEQLFEASRLEPSDLQIGGDVYGRTLLTDIGPGENPWTRTLTFADERIWLPFVSVVRDYNLRQRRGSVRLVGEGSLGQLQPVPELRYRPHSLAPGNVPWTAQIAAQDYMAEVCERLGIPFSREWPSTLRASDIVEDYSHNGPADNGWPRLIGKIPGLMLTVLRDGTWAYTDMNSDEESSQQRRRIRTEFYDRDVATLDRRYRRPKAINVHFVREQELRFDYDEDAEEREALGSGSSVEDGREPRKLEQVVQLPFRTFQKNDGTQIAEGTWMAMKTLFRDLPNQTEPAIATQTVGERTTGPIDFRLLRRIRHNAELRQTYYLASEGGEPLSQKVALIRELLASHRSNFRIIGAWRDRIRKFEAKRVALYDPTAREFGASRPYADITYVPTTRVLTFCANAPTQRALEGWITRGYAARLDQAQSSEGAVRVRDQEAGLIRVSWRTGARDEEELVIPGILKNQQRVADFGDLQQIGLNASKVDELLAGWKFTVVLTCQQAAPNGLGRYHTVRIEPDDEKLKDLLGREVGPSLGPELDIIVPASPTLTARFAWSDDYAQQIDEAFYTGQGAPPDELLVNPDVVEAVAYGSAANLYQQLLDTPAGSIETVTGVELEAVGRNMAVETIRPLGRGATTILTAPGKFSAGAVAAWLPSAIQRQVFGTVQQP